jgi:hypothetical protein
MQRTAHQRFSAIVLVLSCAVGVHQGGAAQVLCIGEDGHVEIEMPKEACCDGDVNAQDANLPALMTAEEACHENDCGACIDIPIVASSQIAVKTVSLDRTHDSIATTAAIVSLPNSGSIAPAPSDVARSTPTHAASIALPLII